MKGMAHRGKFIGSHRRGDEDTQSGDEAHTSYIDSSLTAVFVNFATNAQREPSSSSSHM